MREMITLFVSPPDGTARRNLMMFAVQVMALLTGTGPVNVPPLKAGRLSEHANGALLWSWGLPVNSMGLPLVSPEAIWVALVPSSIGQYAASCWLAGSRT